MEGFFVQRLHLDIRQRTILINEYEIKNIISIDDGWNIAGELEEKIEKAGNDLNVTIKDFCDMYGIEIVAEEAEAYKRFGNFISVLATFKDYR